MFENWETSYQEFYGSRWPGLKESLSKSEKKSYALLNPFLHEHRSLQKLLIEKPAGEIVRQNGLLKEYFLDPASLAPVLALETVINGENLKILDLCAAPGGKSLMLASLIRNSGELILNEPSENRREDLKKVVQNYFSKDVRPRVWLKGLPGEKYYKQQNSYDLILVDAPCSSEKHNLLKLDSRSPSASKKMAQRQYAILSAAWLALKPDGFLCYSTCSVSNFENDGVIEKLLKKHSESVRKIPCAEFFSGQESTEHGYQLFPDRSGIGPIFWTLLQKI